MMEMKEELGYTTYSVEDDKLRFHPNGWLDKEIWLEFKKYGFINAPKQGCFVQVWSPGREDICLKYSPEITDEDTTPEERAEARAERFEQYADNAKARGQSRLESADQISERFAFGQPILVGHHSERKARKDKDRIESNMRAGIDELKKSDYWAWRAQSAINHQEYLNRWDVVYRRIKKLQSEIRKQKASYTPDPKTKPIMQTRNQWNVPYDQRDETKVPFVWVGPGGRGGHWVAREDLPAIEKRAQRYIEHYELQLAYWQAIYDSQPKGGLDGIKEETNGNVKLQVGGAIYFVGWQHSHRGEKQWNTIKRVNRSRDTGEVLSVSVEPDISEAYRRSRYKIGVTQIKEVASKAEVEAAGGIEFLPIPGEPVKEAYQPKPPTVLEQAISEAKGLLEEVERAEIAVNYNPDYYPTPQHTAYTMVRLASIQENEFVLEPSAGGGAIINEIVETEIKCTVCWHEIDYKAQQILKQRFEHLDYVRQVSTENDDFTENEAVDYFDKIIMNPPFSKRQDQKHVKHAYKLLKPGGRIVAIVSGGSVGNDYTQTKFDEWLDEVGGWVEQRLPAGTFQDTNVNAAIIVIDK